MEWFTHWSIERRVLGGFGLVFVGIVVISVISYRNTTVLIENSRLDSTSHELVQLLDSVGEALDATERGHRRYLVTGEESYLKFYRSTVEQMPEYLRSRLMRLSDGSCDPEELRAKSVGFHGTGIRPKMPRQGQPLWTTQRPLEFGFAP